VTSSPSTSPLRWWSNRWTVATLVLTLLLLGPILSVFAAATGDSEGLWPHLFQTVLPRYVSNTLILMGGVGTLSLVFGVTTAWVITRYQFWGRRILIWMLLLPLAMPAYITAYVYTDFLEYAGPAQNALRGLFGWHSARDYWFPEIRSMSGAVLVMSSVLYPYVYIMARTAFKLTPVSLFETARVHNQSLFFKVGLPLARPAIVAGLALVLMETVSDFGTVEFFALETLTLGIFNVWLGMNSLPAAAQIASLAFVFIIILLVLEMYARQRRKYLDTGRRTASMQPAPATRAMSAGCIAICLLPVSLGFLFPIAVLLDIVVRGYSITDLGAVATTAVNSIFVAVVVAGLVMTTAAFMVLVATYRGNRALRLITALSATGYAFPGTILAIGVVTFIGAIDRGLEALITDVFGMSFDGFLTGGIVLVLFACTIRFQAIGYGAMTSGINRLPPNMMAAGRVLGRSFSSSLVRVIIPLLGSSFLAGALLVFVDVMKELDRKSVV